MEAPIRRYREAFPVRIHMTDENGHCRPGDMMRFMQEAAIMQLEHNHPTHAELSAKGRAFILSRISIDFFAPVPYFHTVEAETWPCSSSRGATFDRHFVLHADNGATIAAQAASQWALLDMENKRLLRVEDCEIPFTDDAAVTPSIPLRFRIPKDAVLEEVGTHTVCYSDLDINRHVNNTRYCDLYCDHLPMTDASGTPVRIAALAIAFQREAAAGEMLCITRTAQPDAQGCYYIRTYRQSDGAVNTEAVIRVEQWGCSRD